MKLKLLLIVIVVFCFLLTNGYSQDADFNTNSSAIDYKVPSFNETESALTTATWTSLTASPHAVSRSFCAYIMRNDTAFVYQFGGGATTQLQNVARYNLRTSAWTNNVTTIPFAMSSGSAIADGDSVIYVLGGNSTTGLGKTLKYNIVTNTWTTLADMPVPSTDMLCVKYQDSLIYVICGGDGLFGTVINNAVRLFRMRSATWTSLPAFPASVSMMGGGIFKDTIIAVAGWTGAGGTNVCRKGVINPSNPTSITWTTIASYPTGGVTRMASYACSILGQGAGIACTGGAIDGATVTTASNFWNFCTGTWQTLPPNSLARSNFKGTGAGDSTMYVVGGFTTVGVGNFERLTFTQIDGTCADVARQLNAFNLQTPPAGTRIVTVIGSSTPVTITWDTSASGATYKWIFGNPTVPPRRLTIPSGSNSITTTLGALDAILAANGFTNNGSATDSAVGQWDVWAYKGPGAPGPDSLKATNGPRAITLKRQQVSLSAFSLLSPPTGTRIVTSPIDPSLININWTRSAIGANYRWLFKVGATYTDPATLRIVSNNSGLDTVLTLRNSQVDSILAGIGIAAGDSAVGQWRVRAYATSDSLNSTAPDRTITFRRADLLPLNQDFTSTTFPPPFWALDNGGGATQYWSRAAVGGYQMGSGSATYDYFSAVTTTPLQTLTSNQFPPLIGPNNYLRFSYSHAYYLFATGIAPDSCIIETSTDNGSTWVRLIGMGASQTLSSGTNSSTIMSTVASQPEFTPTLASHWGTKIYQMPVGTNKLRFVAKSGFGNNLFLDNITSGSMTGISGNQLTLTPDKYSLEQNYPNPFNPSTSINFSILKSGLVTLKIYNVLGKEVATLVNEVKNAGNYTLDFNASNLASGVYFYKIQSGSFSDIKRMVLIK